MTKISLLEVRCPHRKKNVKTNEIYQCNSLCVKVGPGSYGEARCRKCRISFVFEVNSHAHVQVGVKVQPIPDSLKSV